METFFFLSSQKIEEVTVFDEAMRYCVFTLQSFSDRSGWERVGKCVGMRLERESEVVFGTVRDVGRFSCSLRRRDIVRAVCSR